VGLRFGGAEWAMIVAGSYLLFAVALSTRFVPRVAGRRVDVSYGVYLFGFPIQQLLIAKTHDTLGPPVLFVASMALACGLAYASWILVESPSLRWARSGGVRSGNRAARSGAQGSTGG
jgi:peptidoglycan/LPS O-acetylase OafA/YrhL